MSEIAPLKLRLFLWADCPKHCPGCCNQDFDIPKLPICKSFAGYSEIMLTGGEPMLYPDIVLSIAKGIKDQNNTAQLYLYTAMTTHPYELIEVLRHIDGLCVTLHEPDDLMPFLEFDKILREHSNLHNKSFRLNVFRNISIEKHRTSLMNVWKIKSDMEWIVNCPLPTGETLMRF